MILATKAGLNPKDVLDVLHMVDFCSPIFYSMGKMMRNRDFTPSFALNHMLKDANLIAPLAQDLNTPTPAAVIIRETIKAAVTTELGKRKRICFDQSLGIRSRSYR